MASDLWLYFIAVFVVILLPGMDMAYVLASSLAAGPRGAIASVLGIASGGVIHVVVGATGVAALMAVFPQLFHALLAAGTLYLVRVGWKIYRSADVAPAAAPAAPVASRTLYRRAVVTCLLNPKAYAFMLAIFPAFVRSDVRSLVEQTTALALITAATQVAVYGSVAALAVRAGSFFKARHRPLSRTMGALLIGAALLTASQAWSGAPPAPSSQHDERSITMEKTSAVDGVAREQGRNDFDFEVGDWQVENRRLTKPLDQGAPWESFTATVHMEKFPGGIGNFDTFIAPGWRPGWMGMAVRFYNGETGLWSIYLANNRDGGLDAVTNRLSVPVVGRFVNGTGVFEDNEIFQGVPVRVRFTWSDTRTGHPKWQQDFSFDGGKTWQANWFMRFTRVKPK